MTGKTEARKQALRHKILKCRSQLMPSEIEDASNKILQFLCKSELYQKSRVIHCFLTLPYEVHTFPIVEACWKDQKQVVIPCLDESNANEGADKYLLHHSLLTSMEHLVLGKYNIPALPEKYQQKVAADVADLCLIPVVGIGAKGERLGYGKGYYDRFLSENSGFHLALAMDFQKVSPIPTAAHDVPMDGLLTETGFQFF